MSSIKDKFSCGFWNVGIITSSAKDIINGKSNYCFRWMKHHHWDKFFADPFPVNEDKDFYYILAEQYSYFTSKGTIVMLKIRKEDFRLVGKNPVIETNYHLSFPFPYSGSIVPEQFRAGKLYAYKDGVETCICDYPVIDPVLFDFKGKKFLFGTLTCDDNKGHNRSLFWFEKKGEKYELKKEKPIKEDVTSSRAAGAFFEIDGQLYRGAQDCERIYGGQTRIMKVDLTEDSYKETEVAIVNSSSSNEFNDGLHTFNPWKDIVVIDGFQNETRYLLKIPFVLYRYFRRLIK